MTGIPQDEFDKAICLSKKFHMPSFEYALSCAWLVANANRDRAAVYRCKVCGTYHLTQKTDSEGILFCAVVWSATRPPPAP
jgi:hypothetical protein